MRKDSMLDFRRCRSSVGMSSASQGKSLIKVQTKKIFMDLKTLSTVFTSVFIAELGDKTQLATMLFASDKDTSKLTVFAGAALALVVTSAIGVAAGSAISHYVSEKTLQYIAGLGFITIGIWTLIKA